MVAQPGQFESESRLPVAQIGQYETPVGSLLAAGLFQPQGLAVKLQALREVGDVDVEMVESALDFHGSQILYAAKLHNYREIRIRPAYI